MGFWLSSGHLDLLLSGDGLELGLGFWVMVLDCLTLSDPLIRGECAWEDARGVQGFGVNEGQKSKVTRRDCALASEKGEI